MDNPRYTETSPEFQSLLETAKSSIEKFLKKVTQTLEEKGSIEKNQPNYVAFPGIAFTMQILPDAIGEENAQKVFETLINNGILIEAPVRIDEGEYMPGYTMERYYPINN